MSLVFAGICSHAPGITGRYALADPALRDPLYAAFDHLREQLEAARPDALIVVAAEHFANFFTNNMPSFAIGMAATALTFIGMNSLSIYLRPFLEMVTHVDVPTLSLILLLLGITGLAGTTLIGATTASATVTTTWQQVSTTYVAAAPGSSNLDLNGYTTSSPTGTCFYADDVSVTRR